MISSLWHQLFCADVTNINNTFIFIMSTIIKENMLGLEIHLINEKKFCNFPMSFILSPTFEIVLNGKWSVLFGSFVNRHVLCIWHHMESTMFEFCLAHYFSKFIVFYIRFVKGTLNELGFIELRSFSVECSLLSVISNSHINCTIGTIEHNEWTAIISIVAGMESVTELVVLPDRVF